MDPLKGPKIEPDDLPDPIEGQDWDAIRAGELIPDTIDDNGALRHDGDVDGDLPEEDDDNPLQDSDDALPDDEDEAILQRNPSKEGGRFDDV